jgi:ATP-dependent DNA ligase
MVSGDKSLRKELDRAYGAYADIGYICSLIPKGKAERQIRENLGSVKIQPGIPVLSRLVERVGTFEEVFDRLGEEVLVQTKYDGLRCQIHKFKKGDLSQKEIIWLKYLKEESNESLFRISEDDVKVKLFTRNLEDVTECFQR